MSSGNAESGASSGSSTGGGERGRMSDNVSQRYPSAQEFRQALVAAL